MLQSSRGAALVASLVLLFGVVALSGGAGAAAPEPDEQPREGRPVDINTASVQQLTAIPGIGETMAQRIVEWREEHGPFQRVEDLMKIQGIGEKSLQKMRPHVTVSKGK